MDLFKWNFDRLVTYDTNSLKDLKVPACRLPNKLSLKSPLLPIRDFPPLPSKRAVERPNFLRPFGSPISPRPRATGGV